MTPALWVTLAAALMGGGFGIIGIWLKRRQDKALTEHTVVQSADVIQTMTLKLLEPYKAEVDTVKTDLADLKRALETEQAAHAQTQREAVQDREVLTSRIAHMETWALQMHTWMEGGAQPPSPTPPEWLVRLVAKHVDRRIT